MPLATIVDPGYKIALFLHILAVVLAFGPTFGYALFFSVAPQHPRATPAILAGVQKCDKYLVNPGMVVLLLAGIYLLRSDGAWETSDAFVSVGFLAIIGLFGLQHGFFQPQVRKAKELAERDLKAGDTLSDEFEAVGQRIGQVGTLAGVDRRRDDLLHDVQTVPIADASTTDRDVRLGGGRAHRPPRVPGLAARGGLRLPRRHGDVPLRHPRPGAPARADRARSPSGCSATTRAKLLVIACNTATSIGADVAREVAAEHGVEVVPVVEPQAEIAAAITDSGRVGVLATPNTVESGAYRRALEAQGRALEVTEVEAPDLAPFIQEGSPFDEGVLEMARAYCAPLKRAEVDTLILGCTHYPLVAPMLQRILGRDVRLVSGGHAVAAAVQRTLESAGLARAPGRRGRLPLPLHRRGRVLPRARHPLPADAARRGRAGRAACRRMRVPTL